jgi:hypothetical protein
MMNSLKRSGRMDKVFRAKIIIVGSGTTTLSPSHMLDVRIAGPGNLMLLSNPKNVKKVI